MARKSEIRRDGIAGAKSIRGTGVDRWGQGLGTEKRCISWDQGVGRKENGGRSDQGRVQQSQIKHELLLSWGERSLLTNRDRRWRRRLKSGCERHKVEFMKGHRGGWSDDRGGHKISRWFRQERLRSGGDSWGFE